MGFNSGFKGLNYMTEKLLHKKKNFWGNNDVTLIKMWKVQLPLSTSWKHIGGAEIQLHSS